MPDRLTAAVDEELGGAAVEHVAHGDRNPLRAAEAAADDPRSLALIGPYRSADVAEAVEATAPVGLPLLAPVATWAGVTRDDEPGCDDAAQHRGTILRLIARDTEVAMRLAADLRATRRRALVIAGEHPYGRQLAGQLRQAGLDGADDPADADVVVLCALADDSEVRDAAALAPLPIIAFDGVQGADFGGVPDVRLVLPTAPAEELAVPDVMAGVGQARRAAQLIVAAARGDGRDRAALLTSLRALGPFDEHGDPIDPPVWLWHLRGDGAVTPERSLTSGSP